MTLHITAEEQADRHVGRRPYAAKPAKPAVPADPQHLRTETKLAVPGDVKSRTRRMTDDSNDA